jgi:hypothetical protein
MEPQVYEIKLDAKYLVILPTGTSYHDFDHIRTALNKWLQSPNDPFFFITDLVKLVKISEEE